MPKQKTPPSDFPQAVLKQIEELAQNIGIARRRRGESQAQWAKKLGVSQPTMARIERGDPSVAMASYVMCLWLVNPAACLADLIAPVNDHAALDKEVAKVRARRQPAATQALQAMQPSLQAKRIAMQTATQGFRPAEAVQPARLAAGRTPVAQGLAALMAKTRPNKND